MITLAGTFVQLLEQYNDFNQNTKKEETFEKSVIWRVYKKKSLRTKEQGFNTTKRKLNKKKKQACVYNIRALALGKRVTLLGTNRIKL